MLLEYFQMIDQVISVDRNSGQLTAQSTVPDQSPVFEGHFPGMPIVPGVLLIEAMAQASGFLVLAKHDFSKMPFLMSVDVAKMRGFVEPGAELQISASLEHDGSGFAVTKAAIKCDDKKIADTQLKLKTVPFTELSIGDVVIERAREVGLMAAIASDGEEQ